MSSDIPFNELQIGDRYGPTRFDTREEAVQRFCREMDDQNPLWTSESPWGGPVTPPLISATLIGLGMIGTRYDPHATVPSRLIQRNIKPIPVGTTISQSGVLVDKYVRKGLEYAAIESVLTDEAGNEYRRVTDHFLLSLERYDLPDTSGSHDPGRGIPLDSAAGKEIAPLTLVAKQPALDDPTRFLDDSSHRDTYAQDKGYKSALLSGYITSGYLNKYLVDHFGPDWLIGGEVFIAFVRAVYQRETITIRARVVDAEPPSAEAKQTIAFQIEKQDGTVAITGWARG